MFAANFFYTYSSSVSHVNIFHAFMTDTKNKYENIMKQTVHPTPRIKPSFPESQEKKKEEF